MFAESEAVGARLRNPSGGKPRKAVAARRKEKRMAAAKGKKRRSRKATAKKTTTKRPARRTAAAKAPKKRARSRRTRKGAARRTSRVMVRGKSVSRAVSTSVRNAKRKSVTYRQYKRGGAAIILRASNPTDQPKAVASFVVGALAGVGVSTLLDRWLATRASSQTGDKVQYGQDAVSSIHAKADGVRVFGQLAVGGVAAAGAYVARKKMPMLAVGLAGFAGAFLIRAGFMVMADHVLPMLFKSKKAADAGDRYFPDRQPAAGSGAQNGPRRMTGGSPHPFVGKPARIGPVATGSVGGCASCKRSGLLDHCNNCGGPAGGCNCNPFPLTDKQACLRRVSGQTSDGCGGVCPDYGFGNKDRGNGNGNGNGIIDRAGNVVDEVIIDRAGNVVDDSIIDRAGNVVDDGITDRAGNNSNGRYPLMPGNGGRVPMVPVQPNPPRITVPSGRQPDGRDPATGPGFSRKRPPVKKAFVQSPFVSNVYRPPTVK